MHCRRLVVHYTGLAVHRKGLVVHCRGQAKHQSGLAGLCRGLAVHITALEVHVLPLNPTAAYTARPLFKLCEVKELNVPIPWNCDI